MRDNGRIIRRLSPKEGGSVIGDWMISHIGWTMVILWTLIFLVLGGSWYILRKLKDDA